VLAATSWGLFEDGSNLSHCAETEPQHGERNEGSDEGPTIPQRELELLWRDANPPPKNLLAGRTLTVELAKHVAALVCIDGC
jgi:hypothetical protein